VHFDEHDSAGRVAVSTERRRGAEVQVAEELVVVAAAAGRRLVVVAETLPTHTHAHTHTHTHTRTSIGATTIYGTRGTRPLQRLRTWGPTVFGPLQLLRLAVFSAGVSAF